MWEDSYCKETAALDGFVLLSELLTFSEFIEAYAEALCLSYW